MHSAALAEAPVLARSSKYILCEGVAIVTHGPRVIALTGLMLLSAALPTTPLWADEGQALPSPRSGEWASVATPSPFRSVSEQRRGPLAIPTALESFEAPRLGGRRSRTDLPFWFDRVRAGEGAFGGGLKIATRPIRLSRDTRLDAAARSERARARLVGISLLALRFVADDEVRIRFRVALPRR